MSARPNIDDYFMAMAELVASRGTCARRRVGCVLVSVKNHVLATGYNGPPSGFAHCSAAAPCPGLGHESGHGLDLCDAIHAESNALLQCRSVDEVATAYCTAAPCASCAKMLLNTACQKVVFRNPYPGRAEELWHRGGREWVQWSREDM